MLFSDEEKINKSLTKISVRIQFNTQVTFYVHVSPKMFRNLFDSMKTWDSIDKAKQEKFIANNMESIYPHLKQNDCHQKLGAYLIVKSCN